MRMLIFRKITSDEMNSSIVWTINYTVIQLVLMLRTDLSLSLNLCVIS